LNVEEKDLNVYVEGEGLLSTPAEQQQKLFSKKFIGKKKFIGITALAKTPHGSHWGSIKIHTVLQEGDNYNRQSWLCNKKTLLQPFLNGRNAAKVWDGQTS